MKLLQGIGIMLIGILVLSFVMQEIINATACLRS